MVYRMQGSGGMGAQRKPSVERSAAKEAQQQERQELRRAILQAEDEWKRYINSLSNLVSQLRNGSLPSSYPLPSAPASDAALVPHLEKQAQNILQNQVPKAYQIAQNLDAAKGARDAASSYAAGQPPVAPGGGLVRQGIPPGDLPGQVQQEITVAAGSAPVLQQRPTGAGQGVYEGPVDDPGAIRQPMMVQADGTVVPAGGGALKKILVVVGVGLAAYLAYRWWRGRGGK